VGNGILFYRIVISSLLSVLSAFKMPSRIRKPMSPADRRALNKMLGLNTEIVVGGDPPVPTMGKQKSPEVPAKLQGGGNPMPTMGEQKSPEVPATLQGGGNPPMPTQVGAQKSPEVPATLPPYVSYLTKGGSRVLMTGKVFDYVRSEEFRQAVLTNSDNRWELMNIPHVSQWHQGEIEHVKSKLNWPLDAREMRDEGVKKRRLTKEREEWEKELEAKLKEPCSRPRVFCGGKVPRTMSCLNLDLTGLQEALEEDELDGLDDEPGLSVRRY